MEAPEQDAAAAGTTELLEPEAPGEPALMAHPYPVRQDGQVACSSISLWALLVVQEVVGEALLRGRLGTARAGRFPVPLSLPEVAVTGAELFQAMPQRDFGYKHYKALFALLEKEEPPETRNMEPRKGC